MIGHCYICGEDTKLTREHIIPQCLGGALSACIYCADCNVKCGHEIDSELARQFGRYATLLCLDRARGSNQSFQIEEVERGLRLECDGATLRRVKPEISGTGALREVIAGSKKELETIMQSLAKKFGLDPDACLVEAIERVPSVAFYQFFLDNALILRAVAKIAYGFACVRYTVVLAENLESAVEWPGIDCTYNPVTQRHVNGIENYIAPVIGKMRALKPRHSRAMVLYALNRGHNVIANHSSIVESAHVEECISAKNFSTT